MKRQIRKWLGGWKNYTFPWYSGKLQKILLVAPVTILLFALSFFCFRIISLTEMGRDVFFIEKMIRVCVPAKLETKVKVNDDYVEDLLSSMSFLKEDKEYLDFLCAQVAEEELYLEVFKRKEFFKHGKNKPVLKKVCNEKEFLLTLEQPLEMSSSDLSYFIQSVEGEESRNFEEKGLRPVLYFSSLDITRRFSGSSDIYIVNFELVQKRNSEKS